jgi:hypothetical protein
MEKLKFGIQLMVLLLAFPVWFIAEMKQADKAMKKNQPEKLEIIDAKKPVATDKLKKDIGNIEFVAIPYTTFMVTGI